MAEPLPKIIYFNGRGRAEIARLLFAAAGKAYEDVRVASHAELKAAGKLPFGQLPRLEYGALEIVQSHAINRYLASKFGFMGANAEEAARVDMVYEGVIDIRNAQNALRSVPEDKKAAETETFTSKTLPLWLGHLEKLLVSNHGGDGYFVGDKLSLADIAVQNLVFGLKPSFPKVFEETPKLNGHYQRVSEYPGIAEWLKKRPETAF